MASGRQANSQNRLGGSGFLEVALVPSEPLPTRREEHRARQTQPTRTQCIKQKCDDFKMGSRKKSLRQLQAHAAKAKPQARKNMKPNPEPLKRLPVKEQLLR
jgi:hypothetical protein